MSATIANIIPIGLEALERASAEQRLKPSSDRRNVTELWRVKEERAFLALCAELKAARPPAPRKGDDDVA